MFKQKLLLSIMFAELTSFYIYIYNTLVVKVQLTNNVVIE